MLISAIEESERESGAFSETLTLWLISAIEESERYKLNKHGVKDSWLISAIEESEQSQQDALTICRGVNIGHRGI